MLGEAAALAAAACWAVGSHLFGRIARAGMPAGAMNLGKCFTATFLFATTAVVVTGRLVPTAGSRELALLASSGVVGLALGDTAYLGAMVAIGVRRALLLLSTAPVFTAVGGALFLDETLRARDAAAICAVVTGVALVVLERAAAVARTDPTADTSELASPTADGIAEPAATVSRALGIGLGMCAGVGQAAGSLLSRRAMAGGMSALDASLVRIAAGTFGMVALAAILGRLRAWTDPLRPPRRALAVAGSSVVGTFIGIWLAQFAIAHSASTAVAATLLATSPLFALPLGRWLEREPITVRAVAGTLLAVAGVATLTLARG